LSLTTNIYQTYMEAPDFLKRHYLRLFFDKIYVKDKKLWKVVENPVFSVLRKQEKLIIDGHWLADIDAIRTFWAAAQKRYLKKDENWVQKPWDKEVLDWLVTLITITA